MSIELGENETRHEQGNDVYCELTDAEGGYLDHDIVYIGPIDGRHTVEYMFTLAHNYGFLDEMREAWAGQTQISREDDLSQPLRAAVKQSVLNEFEKLTDLMSVLDQNSKNVRSMSLMSADSDVRALLMDKVFQLDIHLLKMCDLKKSFSEKISDLEEKEQIFVNSCRVRDGGEIDGETYDTYNIYVGPYMDTVGSKWVQTLLTSRECLKKCEEVLSDLKDFYDTHEFVKEKSKIKNLEFVNFSNTSSPNRQAPKSVKAMTV